MRMCHFWTQNGPLTQMRNISENLLIYLVPFIHVYLHAKNQSQISMNEILTIKEYWNLIGHEPFLAITWETDFSQACSFCKMLMNHKNLCLTQIPDKTNDMIFLKSPKTLFLAHFWPFLAISAQWGFYPKNQVLSQTTIYGPLTPC